ncbi:hypothetical protein AK812_SmicGene12959 [Symbiodinium microadriaticum]|uniref:IPT/TIG domain-containing protein n=1 Tax=Symbiodinium microadriaticum TaxID=2951 RepID=A0A1Q9E9B8_SYMMI|nr:hypothetical protein AK812_SmicGene12959 [Symbiodinium microadriaticum]
MPLSIPPFIHTYIYNKIDAYTYTYTYTYAFTFTFICANLTATLAATCLKQCLARALDIPANGTATVRPEEPPTRLLGLWKMEKSTYLFRFYRVPAFCPVRIGPSIWGEDTLISSEADYDLELLGPSAQVVVGAGSIRQQLTVVNMDPFGSPVAGGKVITVHGVGFPQDVDKAHIVLDQIGPCEAPGGASKYSARADLRHVESLVVVSGPLRRERLSVMLSGSSLTRPYISPQRFALLWNTSGNAFFHSRDGSMVLPVPVYMAAVGRLVPQLLKQFSRCVSEDMEDTIRGLTLQVHDVEFHAYAITDADSNGVTGKLHFWVGRMYGSSFSCHEGLANDFDKHIEDSVLNHNDKCNDNKHDHHKSDSHFLINHGYQQHIIFCDPDFIDGDVYNYKDWNEHINQQHSESGLECEVLRQLQQMPKTGQALAFLVEDHGPQAFSHQNRDIHGTDHWTGEHHACGELNSKMPDVMAVVRGATAVKSESLVLSFRILDMCVECLVPPLAAGAYQVHVRVPNIGDAVAPEPFIAPLLLAAVGPVPEPPGLELGGWGQARGIGQKASISLTGRKGMKGAMRLEMLLGSNGTDHPEVQLLFAVLQVLLVSAAVGL